jgi:8-oxo-dGTP pyrophosphatase MutT (NUDIX family)
MAPALALGVRRFSHFELLVHLKRHLNPLKDAPRYLGPDHAAVVLLLTLEEGDVQLLFAKRAENPDDPWSGHIAFPGGRSKEVDSSLDRTACREFFEETFVDICKRAELMGFLPPLSPSNMPTLSVTPFVAYSDRKFVFSPSREVTEVFWASLRNLNEATVEITLGDGSKLRRPAYVHGQHVIWGLTAHILDELLDVLRQG